MCVQYGGMDTGVHILSLRLPALFAIHCLHRADQSILTIQLMSIGILLLDSLNSHPSQNHSAII